MRFAWMVLVLAACTEQEKGIVGIDNGIGLTASTPIPLAVGASFRWTFYDVCTPNSESFCDFDSVRSVGSTTVTGPFEVVSSAASGIRVKATGPGSGQMRTSVTQNDGETRSFTRDVKSLAADRAQMYCFGFQNDSAPQIVLAGSVVSSREPGKELGILFSNLFAGTQLLYSDDIFPFDAPGFMRSGTTLTAPNTSGLVTITAPFDTSFAFQADVVTLAQIDALELVKVPTMTNTYVGIQIKPTVNGRPMCRAPWEAMTLTAGPAGTCTLTETLKLPGKMPQVQLQSGGTCRVEAKITGTTLVATMDLSL
jgi:hypothetical protein